MWSCKELRSALYHPGMTFKETVFVKGGGVLAGNTRHIKVS